MNADDQTVVIGRAVMAHIAGDVNSCASWLADACETPRDGFATACGLASMVAHIASENFTGTGPLIVELEPAVTDPNHVEGERWMDLGAFIAAVGNEDFEGAALVFYRLAKDEEDAGLFLGALVRMAAACVKLKMGEGLSGAEE